MATHQDYINPQNEQWKYLGEGSYNEAYINSSETLVLKVFKDLTKLGASPVATDELDRPERSVRIWNTINPNIKPKAQLYNHEGEACWICPYIEG